MSLNWPGFWMGVIGFPAICFSFTSSIMSTVDGNSLSFIFRFMVVSCPKPGELWASVIQTLSFRSTIKSPAYRNRRLRIHKCAHSIHRSSTYHESKSIFHCGVFSMAMKARVSIGSHHICQGRHDLFANMIQWIPSYRVTKVLWVFLHMLFQFDLPIVKGDSILVGSIVSTQIGKVTSSGFKDLSLYSWGETRKYPSW